MCSTKEAVPPPTPFQAHSCDPKCHWEGRACGPEERLAVRCPAPEDVGEEQGPLAGFSAVLPQSLVSSQQRAHTLRWITAPPAPLRLRQLDTPSATPCLTGFPRPQTIPLPFTKLRVFGPVELRHLPWAGLSWDVRCFPCPLLPGTCLLHSSHTS